MSTNTPGGSPPPTTAEPHQDQAANLAALEAFIAAQENVTAEQRARRARYIELREARIEQRLTRRRERGKPVHTVLRSVYRDAQRYAVNQIATECRPAAPTANVSRQRDSRRNRPGQRRTRRATARAGDDDSGPAEPPPPLPLRIAGPAGDDSAVRTAFLSILNRRYPGIRWDVDGGAS